MRKAIIALVLILAAAPVMAQSAGLEAVEELLAAVQPAPPLPPEPPAAPAPPAFVAAPLVGRSYLGIGVAEIDAERAKALKLAEERGVEITRVEPDSPADKAGLKQGDVVLEYNGQRVEGTEQFVRMVRETPPGRKVTLLVSRNGATQIISATVGKREARAWALGPEFEANMERLRENMRNLRIEIDAPRAYISWRSSMLGVEAESLTPQLAEFFGVKEGVLVRAVIKGTPAEKAGVKAGDVITKVDGEAVRTPNQIASRLRSLREKRTFPLTVVRNHQETTLTVTIEPERWEGREPAPRPRTVSAPKGVRL